jgi:hypothetical protein
VSALLEDGRGAALDAGFDWSAAEPYAVWLRLDDGSRIGVERIARDALETRFGFVSDPRA